MEDKKTPQVYAIDLIGKSRIQLMGIATILIILLHTAQMYGIDGEEPWIRVKNLFFNTCEVGVDVFLLLSGYGLYCSLERGRTLKEFYFKRAVRIYPEFIIVVGILGIVNKSGLVSAVCDLSTLSFWRDRELKYWFMAIIVPLYIVYPFIHRIISKGYSRTAFLFGGIVTVNIIMFLLIPEFYSLRVIATDRVPVFILGAIAAKERKRIISSTHVLLSIVLMLLSIIGIELTPWLLNYRLLYIPTACGIVISCSVMVVKLSSSNIFNQTLTWLGKRSLSVYLAHGALSLYMIDHDTLSFLSNKSVKIITATVLSLISSYILDKVCQLIRSLIGNSKKALANNK